MWGRLQDCEHSEKCSLQNNTGVRKRLHKIFEKQAKKKTSRGKNAVNSLIPNELAFKKRLDLNTENVAHAEIVHVTNVHDVFSNLSSLQQSARALVARHSCYGLSSYQQEYI